LRKIGRRMLRDRDAGTASDHWWERQPKREGYKEKWMGNELNRGCGYKVTQRMKQRWSRVRGVE